MGKKPLTRSIVTSWGYTFERMLLVFGREMAYPTNVLHFATECGNKNHPAAFPLELPAWFIRLFTKPGETVLDPFMGSGTTAVAAKRSERHYIGLEISEQYCEMARAALKSENRVLHLEIAEQQEEYRIP